MSAVTGSRRAAALVYQAAGMCLVYPDAMFHERLPLIESGCQDPDIVSFLTHARAIDPAELAAHYVRTFDFKNRHSLYLSWWSDGDTRRRGMSLVRFKEVYRAHGLDFTSEELPDFLPAVLEFSAQAGPQLLLEHRPGIELLRLSLTEADTPYARILDAVCRTLPGPSPQDLTEARRMVRAGPPREQVGLAAYGAGRPLLPLLDTGTGDRADMEYGTRMPGGTG